jgi:hypothetical protein
MAYGRYCTSRYAAKFSRNYDAADSGAFTSMTEKNAICVYICLVRAVAWSVGSRRWQVRGNPTWMVMKQSAIGGIALMANAPECGRDEVCRVARWRVARWYLLMNAVRREKSAPTWGWGASEVAERMSLDRGGQSVRLCIYAPYCIYMSL